ncbi:hypothetical protein MA16_Dca020250 [Dendrobium catenatum]|uniref:Ubiquitin-like protease family profile domain-containing protein n=1 Tax=Dendrobium catenatum TaxID=906689 RepID=A0A2I0X605_9ASPA|nr:hypothetical protein MA16_Dca020250 [Dendrobium catenatum]
MYDTFFEIIPVEVEEKFKDLNIYQFLHFPGFEQNAPLIYQLLTMWSIEKQSFIIEGHVVPFTADEVALLTGLLNRELFIEHVNYSSVHSCNFIINPIIDGSHWTLLVGYRDQRKWEFYDSVPNPMHRSVAIKIVSFIISLYCWKISKLFFSVLNSIPYIVQIASLYRDCKKAFDDNIKK